MSKTKSAPLNDTRHALIPISACMPHPRNYRKHPDAQISRIQASLLRFGQVRSVVVQEGAPGSYLIVAGHGLIEAAQRMHWETVHADIIPATWSAEQVEGYLVADNQLSATAEDDQVLLAELLQTQQNAGFDVSSLGSSAEELAQMLEKLSNEIPNFQPVSEAEQSHLDRKNSVLCPECGHEFIP